MAFGHHVPWAPLGCDTSQMPTVLDAPCSLRRPGLGFCGRSRSQDLTGGFLIITVQGSWAACLCGP